MELVLGALCIEIRLHSHVRSSSAPGCLRQLAQACFVPGPGQQLGLEAGRSLLAFWQQSGDMLLVLSASWPPLLR